MHNIIKHTLKFQIVINRKFKNYTQNKKKKIRKLKKIKKKKTHARIVYAIKL